ncbi:STM3941 family protein [Capnocytophaga sputigena]|mgnify:FL=1|uniref:STM3941 family protein n=1 Tax=Capnocytophaga sputigena TaxID=1019 RepID=UPI0028D3141E|nr:STM3941 family protein [Capnocytophaga sputigena]
MERIEIFTSKKKNVFLLFLVIIFLAVGIFCFLNANELSNDGKRSIIFIEVISIIVVIFALIALVFIIKNLLNNQWVLTIDEKALHIRIQKYYLIPWQEIIGFQELEIKGNKSILIQVKNPETLIANEKNFFVKEMMQWSQKMYGAPISIASSTMKISHKELVSLLLVSFVTYKDKN